MTRIGHVVAGFLSMVCVLFAGVALGDGRSVIIVKASNVGPLFHDGYGVGVWKDAKGNDWTDDAHPVKSLNCSDHEERGNGVKAFGTIALILSCFAVLVSLLGAGSEGGTLGMVNAGLQAGVFLSFLLSMAIGWSLYDETFDCDNSIVPRLRLKDLFELNYGLFFLLAGTVVGLLNIIVLVATGSMKDVAVAGPVTETTNEPLGDKTAEKADV
eukprot:TRINITY_DN458_c0_g7_i1.p1 TRINITY_DN458_c0_g7~~TRINITY_DN458_c0_g7_i1.p1  ORF type:complete len:213 (+),score=82.29 TRINITY_DN458_c0_g7_i1:78-716(+)